MSPEDLEAMMRITAANRMEYCLSRGTKALFWERIRELLTAEIGKAPKKIQFTVKNVVEQHRARGRLGMPSADTSLGKYIDEWIERLDQLDDEEAEEQKLAEDQYAKVSRVSARAMGVRQFGKRVFASVDEEEDEVGWSEAEGERRGDQGEIDGAGAERLTRICRAIWRSGSNGRTGDPDEKAEVQL